MNMSADFFSLSGPAPNLSLVQLDLTTKCNLRCVYCPKSFPGNEEELHFGVDRIPSLIDELKSIGARYLRVSGYLGEITTHPQWKTFCEQFLEAGFGLEAITNLAKRYDQSELEVLAKFNRIVMSCDTSDPKLFPLVRRKVGIERVFGNVTAILEEAKRKGGAVPHFCMNAVITDKTVFGLEKTIQDALALGIREFSVNDLALLGEDPKAEIVLRPVWTLPLEQVREAKLCLERAAKCAQDAGALFVQAPGLLDAIEKSIAQGGSGKAETGTWDVPPPATGQTRYCTQVWKQTYVDVGGNVRACCNGGAPALGNLSTATLSEILTGPTYREFRAGHLSGSLPSICTTCPLAEVVDVPALHEKVSGLMQDLGAIVEQHLEAWSGKRVLIYGAGGHTRQLLDETRIATIPLLGIVDKNPALHGHYLSGIPVFSVSHTEQLRPEVIVISSLVFQDQIYEQLAFERAQGVQIVRLYAKETHAKREP